MQTIPQHGQRLYQLVDWSGETKALAKKVAKAEEAIYADESDPLVNWDETAVQAGLEAAGFTIATRASSIAKKGSGGSPRPIGNVGLASLGIHPQGHTAKNY